MASAYGTFANKGVHVKPVAITKILDRNGNVIEDESTAKPEETRVMSEREAYEMTTMLQAVIESGTGTGAAIGRPAAGKTGTTDDNKDAWFVGYTPTIVTAVWIGDDTGAHSLGEVYGGTIPAQIWRDYMTKATEDESSADFDVPSGMRRPSRAVETPRKETVEEKKPSTTEKKKKDEATSDSDSKDSAESARKEQAAKTIRKNKEHNRFSYDKTPGMLYHRRATQGFCYIRIMCSRAVTMLSPSPERTYILDSGAFFPCG